MLERQGPSLLNPPDHRPGLLTSVGAGIRGADTGPGQQFQPTIQWFFGDKGAGEVDTANTYGATPTFTRATTATTVDSTGTIVSVASGVPRSYYDPSTLSYLGYLAEGARTNQILQSEDFATTWTNVQSTDLVDQTVAPDGTTTADLITEDATATVNHDMRQTVVGLGATASVTFSCFFKRATAGTRNAYLALTDTAFATLTSVTVDPDDGSVVTTVGSPTATSVKAYPNGWYLVSVTQTTDADGGQVTVRVGMSDGTNAAYNGDGVSNIYVWGAQLELGAFASSYIPTTTAAVTRNADVLTYPSTNILSSSVGTAFAQVYSYASTTLQAWITGGDNNGRILWNTTGPTVYNIANAAIGANYTGNSNVGVLRSIASAWDSNGVAITEGGGTPGTGAGVANMTSSSIEIGHRGNGNNQPFGVIHRVALYYNKRLPDGTLQILTAG